MTRHTVANTKHLRDMPIEVWREEKIRLDQRRSQQDTHEDDPRQTTMAEKASA